MTGIKQIDIAFSWEVGFSVVNDFYKHNLHFVSMVLRFDHISFEIIRMLSMDGRAKLSEIARRIGVSHVTVMNRLNAMVRDGYARVSLLIDPERMGLKVALLFLETRGTRYRREILELFERCPRVVFAASMLGEYDLMGMVVAEDERMIEVFMGSCTMRTHRAIRKSSLILLGRENVDLLVRLKMVSEKRGRITPCGRICVECEEYSRGCVGCPSVEGYRGPFKAARKD